MEWVETTGHTVEEALDVALDQLGVLEGDAEYEVLTEPKAGLFGRFGGNDARLRVRVKPISREKPSDRRRGRRNRRDGGSSRSSRGGSRGRSGGSSDGRGESAESVKPGGGEGRDRSTSSSGRERDATRPSRRRGGRSRSRNSEKTGGGRAAHADEGAAMEDQPEISVEEQSEAAETFTRGLVDTFELSAEVTSRIDGEILLIEVEGDNLGLLVGPKGITLHAIEELVRTVVQRQTGGHGMRLHVDVAGYRAKRREALAEFTRGLVEKVLETGREQVLNPMPPPDRKAVHDTVAEFDGVETLSEGEEPRRRVVIRQA